MARLARTLGVREGEDSLVLWVGLVFLMIQATHGLGANAGDALFFRRFGVDNLPYMFLILGVVAAVGLTAYGAALSRFSLKAVLLGTLLGIGLLYALERALIASDPPGLYPTIWLTINVANLTTFTLMWNVAAEVCDTRQGKRLFPLFASAGILGGIIGNLATGPLAQSIGTENLLPVVVAILFAALVPVQRAAGFARERDQSHATNVLDDVRAGARAVMQNRLLRLLAGAALLFSVMFFAVVFAFSEQVAAEFPDEAELAQFLGLFSSIATASAFVVSLFVANRLFARVGIVLAVLLLPGVYVIGFSLWLASFTLVTAAAVRWGQWVVLNGISGTAANALYNVVPPARRSVAMSFVAAIPAQLGVVVSGLWLLLAQNLLSDSQQFGVAALVAVALTAIVFRMRRAYTDALVDAVKTGVVGHFNHDAAPGVAQLTTTGEAWGVLTAALADPDAARRRVAAQIIGRSDAADATTLLAPLVEDADPSVRIAACEALLRLGPTADSRPVGRRALRDDDPRVRASGAAIVGATDEATAAVNGMLRSNERRAVVAALAVTGQFPGTAPAVRDVAESSEPRVRAMAMTSLGQLGDVNDRDMLMSALHDRSRLVRLAAAEAIRGENALEEQVATLLDGPPHVREAALLALEDSASPMLTRFASDRVGRARRLQHWRTALRDGDGARGLLFDELARRQRVAEQDAIRALQAFERRQDLDAVLRGLAASDPDVRANALEALESAAHSRLGHEVAQLAEADPPPADGRDTAVIAEIAEDTDPWLRSLARHVTSLTNQARSGADLNRAPDETTLLTEIDRLVALRKVTMFTDLDIEDLEAIADVAQERSYEAGALVFRNAEPGDEMLMIVAGEVSISYDDDGARNEIRRYGPGETVGELAVLRNRPRASDVYAATDVRALTIDGASLLDVLDERPEAALAMLASLAERLATMPLHGG